MALDTGGSMQEPFNGPTVHEAAPSVESLAFAPGAPLGSGLRAAREFLGLTLQDIADITKIRKAYLAAVEAMDLSLLPSRPFAIGYVRAYAGALHIDADRAVARFKDDAPEREEPLRAPVGVSKETDPRVTLMALGGVIVLAAIVIWNIAQRAMRDNDAQPEVAIIAPPATPPAAAVAGPAAVALGSALPPPVEATVPAPYVTPGLPGNIPEKIEAPTAPRVQGPPAAIYGAAATDSMVSLQAVHTVTLVVHGADSKPIFVKVLAAGETYRAPNTPGVSLDVSNPQSVDVFVAGQYRGALNATITPISTLLNGLPKPSVLQVAPGQAKPATAAKPGTAAAKPGGASAATTGAPKVVVARAAGATSSPSTKPVAQKPAGKTTAAGDTTTDQPLSKPAAAPTIRAAAPLPRALSALPSRPAEPDTTQP